MINIPTPAELPEWNRSESETHNTRVNRILDEFILAVSTDDFQALSSDKEKLVFYPAEAHYAKHPAFNDAVERLRAKGWDVSWRQQTSAAGWFNTIALNV